MGFISAGFVCKAARINFQRKDGVFLLTYCWSFNSGDVHDQEDLCDHFQADLLT